MSSFLKPGSPRASSRGRSSPLPSYSSAIHEKTFVNGRVQSGFFTVFPVPIPGVPGRQLRLPLPIPPRLYHSTTARFGRKRGCLILIFGCLTVLWTVFAFAKRFGTHEKQWPTPFQSDTTLVFQRDDLKKIWEWEISSGHYPSKRPSALLDFLLLVFKRPLCVNIKLPFAFAQIKFLTKLV